VLLLTVGIEPNLAVSITMFVNFILFYNREMIVYIIAFVFASCFKIMWFCHQACILLCPPCP
jgi:hypothetical protein